jgi:hypothetical protein
MRLFITIPKSKDQIFDHYIGLYDKGTHVYDTGDPTIMFSYRNIYKYDGNDEILDRSFDEIYYTTEFFSDILELAKLIGPFEEE